MSSQRAPHWTQTTALLLLACSAEPAPPGAEARACAELAGFYRGFHAPVSVVDSETDPESGKVRIDYEGTDDMNRPVDGVALCRFRGSRDGRLEATDALVDENRLTDGEIAAFNASH